MSKSQLARLSAQVPEIKALQVKVTKLEAELAEAKKKAWSAECNYDMLNCKVGELEAENKALRRDAAIGDVVWRFIDRMNDVAPECGDPAERILAEFVGAVTPAIDAAMKESK